MNIIDLQTPRQKWTAAMTTHDDLIKRLAQTSLSHSIIDQISTAVKERDALRSLLSRISAEATRTPIVGGHVYEIDGVLMGQIDAALTTKQLL